MNKTVSILAFIVCLVSEQGFTQSSNNKETWLTSMQKELPGVLCQPDQYFIQCYQTTEQECIDNTTLFVKACLNNIIIALPNELSKEQGHFWGERVGRCSYDLYEKFMKNKKLNKPNCQINTPTQSNPSKP